MTPEQALEMLRQMWQNVSATPPIHSQIAQAFSVLEMALDDARNVSPAERPLQSVSVPENTGIGD